MTPETFNRANELHDEQEQLKKRLEYIKAQRQVHGQIKVGNTRLFDNEMDLTIYDMAICRIKSKLKKIQEEFDSL